MFNISARTLTVIIKKSLITVRAASLGNFRVQLHCPRLRGEGKRALQKGGQAGGGQGHAPRTQRARRRRTAALRPPTVTTSRQSTMSIDCYSRKPSLLCRSQGKCTNFQSGVAEPSSGPGPRSYVSLLNELCELYGMDVEYELVGDTGPPHMREFTIRASVGQHIRLARGTTKKAARQLAAQQLYSYLRDNLSRLTTDFVEVRLVIIRSSVFLYDFT